MISPECLVFHTNKASLFALGGVLRGLFLGNRYVKKMPRRRGVLPERTHEGTREDPGKKTEAAAETKLCGKDERSFQNRQSATSSHRSSAA